MTETEPVNLVTLLRCGVPEITHKGHWAYMTRGRAVAGSGDMATRVPLRSSGKPLQLWAMLDAGLRDLELTDAELAIMCSSHNGEPDHLAIVLNLLAKVGLGEQDLDCGVHTPYRSWVSTRPATNNCSGKHAAMLLLSKVNGWGVEGYVSPSHPVQVAIRQRMERLFTSMSPGTDGCGVPTYACPLSEIAAAYETVLDSPDIDGTRIRTALKKASFYTGGTDRIETHLNRNYPVIAKPGSDGLWVVSAKGRGALAVKVTSGSENAAAIFSISVMRTLGILAREHDWEIERLLEWDLLTTQGHRAGSVEIQVANV